MSLVSVVCSQVEVSATDRSLVQRSPTGYVCVSVSAVKCNINSLHVQRVGRKEVRIRKKERNFRNIQEEMRM